MPHCSEDSRTTFSGLHQIAGVHAPKASSNSSLFTLISLGPQQITGLFIVQNFARALVPHASAIDAQFADDASLLKMPIPQNDIRNWRRRDQLHENVRSPVCLGQILQEWRYRSFIAIVPAALTLRLEHIAFASFNIEGKLPRFLAGLTIVHGVNVCKGFPKSFPCWRVLRYEATKSRRLGRAELGCGEDLLNLLSASELGENSRAFDRSRPLKVISCLPGCLVGIVRGPVARAHVNDRNLEFFIWIAGQAVDELALGAVGDTRALEDFCERQAEYWAS